MRRACAINAVLLAAGLLAGRMAPGAEERHSNGLGGGRWSDPTAWHGGQIPSASEHAVITAADEIVFDGGMHDRPDCAALSIDPGGVLSFRLDGGEHRLTVAGPVESYGVIRLDATRAPGSRAILALAAEQPDRRVIRLKRGSSMLLYGAASAAAGPNITLAAVHDGAAASGEIEAAGDVMLDLQNTGVSGIHLRISGIDNTGFRPGQRLNLTGNLFTDGARLTLTRCDTPVIAGNRFAHEGGTAFSEPAISLDQCSLVSCRDNTIRGYARGIDVSRDVDVSIQHNTVEGAQTGIALRAARNGMLRGNRLSDCELGLHVDESSGTVETLRLDNTRRGILLRRVTLQLADISIASSPENAVPLTLNEAAATLLNCNIPADAIRMEGARPPGSFWVQTMYYLVVRVTGKIPLRALVHVGTAAVSGGVPAAAADLNVRNVPARLSADGLTPLPRTQRPVIVRGWRIGADRQRRDAPFYDLTVIPAADQVAPTAKPLHAQVIEPRDSWFRAEPDAPTPTLEVRLK